MRPRVQSSVFESGRLLLEFYCSNFGILGAQAGVGARFGRS